MLVLLLPSSACLPDMCYSDTVTQTTYTCVLQYRPRTLDDLVIHKDIGDSLRKLVSVAPTPDDLWLGHSTDAFPSRRCPLETAPTCCSMGRPEQARRPSSSACSARSMARRLRRCPCALPHDQGCMPTSIPIHYQQQHQYHCQLQCWHSPGRVCQHFPALDRADQGRDEAMESVPAQPRHRDRADDGAEQLPRGDEPERCGEPGPPHRAGGHQGARMPSPHLPLSMLHGSQLPHSAACSSRRAHGAMDPCCT